jgi:hypothetical protein
LPTTPQPGIRPGRAGAAVPALRINGVRENEESISRRLCKKTLIFNTKFEIIVSIDKTFITEHKKGNQL